MKTHDGVIAILAILIFILMSLPYQFEFNYWAEAPLLWAAYFVAGGILAVYIFYLFLQTRRDLLSEEEDKKEVQQ